ncbi:hypothetical protein ZIOFF_020191 [Zingiber officinale]|uniref:O-methyltransferase C-terminal domain-containing protein n=1 Tax=Zingiber officinale TaxID=94328 RepID=A0A8J5LC46_ZINOF|nr:hypothetical protein ZIOFF_020191 [Zingiber officinale]
MLFSHPHEDNCKFVELISQWILHDWGDEECVKTLKNCRKALPENGRAMVVECLLPAIPEQTAQARAVLQIDLDMMGAAWEERSDPRRSSKENQLQSTQEHAC